MKYVSINGQSIRHNIGAAKRGETLRKPIRIARTPSDSHPDYAYEISIEGPATLCYTPDAPQLKCGARLVLKCEDVRVIR